VNWIPCGNPVCIMVAGHPGPYAMIAKAVKERKP
jgi:hypothetical protein